MTTPESKPNLDDTHHKYATDMGRLVLGESKPQLDVQVETIGPVTIEPVGAEPYLGTAKYGIEIPESDNEAEIATEYAKSIFPNSQFSYLGSGRYGIVLADETGKAYKIYRSSLFYSRVEKEAGALQLLADEGLAPKLHLLVDAGEAYRLDQKAHDYKTFGFKDVEVPRINSDRELPILVMDRVDITPLEEATPEKILEGFSRIAEVFLRERIYSYDCEVSVDKKTGEVILMDVGELHQGNPKRYASMSKEQQDDEILKGLILDFNIMNSELMKAYKKVSMASD